MKLRARARRAYEDAFVRAFAGRPFDRRGFLRGGLGALGLTALQLDRVARAQGVGPSRFLFIYTPAGREPSWRTGVAGPGFKLGPTMTMFEPWRGRMCLLDGFTIVNFSYKINAHLGPLHCLLGGRPPINKGGNFGGNLSAGSQRTFDHLLADRIGKASPVRSIVIGGRDKNNNQASQTLSWTGPEQPELPLHEPDKTFAALFAGGQAGPIAAAAGDAEARRRAQEWERDVLGLARSQMSFFRSRLGREELRHLETYEANLHEAFQRATAAPPVESAWTAPESCKSLDRGMLEAGLPAAEYERHHDLQSRTLAAALACGRTRVAVYTMGSHLGGMTVPGGAGAHHMHDDGAFGHYRAFDVYYGNRVAFLLKELDRYPEGAGTVLDNTVVVWTSDIGWTPSEHDHERHPIYLFGGVPGRKLKMGQYVSVPSDVGAKREVAIANPKNRRLHEVLLTIATAMGVDDLEGFADPAYVQGPVTELLA